MIVCTYIMNHPIVLTRGCRDAVLAQLSTHQSPDMYPDEAGSWMASMQLKYFFSLLRSVLYTRNLINLQNILRSSTGKRHRTAAFATILGLAFVLEECQHTLLLQLEGRIYKQTCNEQEARRDFRDEYRQMDAEFDFVCNLMHCKYQNGRMTQQASLAQWIETTHEAVEKKFLRALNDESLDNCEHHHCILYDIAEFWC